MYYRYALTADKTILRGPLYRSEYICVSIALRITATWESISRLCALQTSTVCPSISSQIGHSLICILEWQWDQLRIMKVGGNESATKFFQSNGGTAALNSKDPKTKYTSNAATKYKDELKRRAARDATEWVSYGTWKVVPANISDILMR